MYEKIKARVGNYNASETVWQLLDLRLGQVEYQTGFKTRPPRAAIVGSGPGGLRCAIEVSDDTALLLLSSTLLPLGSYPSATR